jgi:predicted dehydrogenase
MRRLASAEPETISVHAEPNPLGADHTSIVSIHFTNGISGEIVASWTSGPGRMLTIELEGARLEVDGLIAPHGGHSLSLQEPGSVSRVRTVGGFTSYDYQLGALVAAVRDGEPMPTSGEDLAANAEALDLIYREMSVGTGALL